MWDTFSTPEAEIVEQVHSNIQKQLGKKVGTLVLKILLLFSVLFIFLLSMSSYLSQRYTYRVLQTIQMKLIV